MTSEIDKLKHFHVENYSNTNFTDNLNDGEEFLYTTIRYKDDKEVTLLCKYVKNKHIGNGAFDKRPISIYNFDTKEWTDNKNPICWHGGLFEYKYNILTGRYFNQCHLLPYKINKGWTPRPTITIDCVEIEIAPDNWIMAVDANNTNLLLLNAYYNIQ